MNKMGGSDDKKILLGDDASEKAMSFQLAQAFYSEITEKAERLCEEYSPSFILTVENVKQLHNRITQSSAQYNVVTANTSFSVRFMNESSERYSSIERETRTSIKLSVVNSVFLKRFYLNQVEKAVGCAWNAQI